MLAVGLVSVAELIGAGRSAVRFVAGNLPAPRNSTHTRVVELVRPTSSFGRMYDVLFAVGAESPPFPPGSRLQVELSSGGKTRLLLVRRGHLPASRGAALRDLVIGAASLRAIPDRGWLDLGPVPPPDGEARVQVIGLLPAPFGFEEPVALRPEAPTPRIEIWRPDAPAAPVVSTAPRYRIVVAAPISAGEILRRALFFVSASRLLQVALALATVLLAFGCVRLARGRSLAAVACLVPGTVLLHAAVLPPLQGADETSHIATVEKIVFGESPLRIENYPRSIALAVDALEMDRVQFHPDEPLALDPAARARLRSFLAQHLDAEARQTGPAPFEALVQDPRARSPLFFALYRILAAPLRGFSILDRLVAARLLSALLGLSFFLLGCGLLRGARLSAEVAVCYGLVFLVPYIVGVLASCSNYAAAIGLGGFLAASALAAILSPLPRARRWGSALVLAGSWLGILFWEDFVFVALASSTALVAAAVLRLRDRLPAAQRPVLTAGFLAGSGAVLALLVALVDAGTLAKVGVRLPLERVVIGGADYRWMVVTAACPFLVASVIAYPISRMRPSGPGEPAGRASPLVAWSLPAIFVLLFLITPYTTVPFEVERVGFRRLVALHDASFWSNNLSWDQDRLFWKFYFGAFGWHDVFYPDLVYAVARWAAVAAFVSLPLLAYRFVRARPRVAAALVLTTGTALSFAVVTETLRYLEPANPWGRFVLPYLPLAALPVLATIEGSVSLRALRALVAVAVSLQVWTALYVVPARYLGV